MKKLLLSDFDFELPQGRIAQKPKRPRDRSRLMVVHTKTQTIKHRHFRDIIDYLIPLDVLVLNDSKIIPARLKKRQLDCCSWHNKRQVSRKFCRHLPKSTLLLLVSAFAVHRTNLSHSCASFSQLYESARRIASSFTCIFLNSSLCESRRGARRSEKEDLSEPAPLNLF